MIDYIKGSEIEARKQIITEHAKRAAEEYFKDFFVEHGKSIPPLPHIIDSSGGINIHPVAMEQYIKDDTVRKYVFGLAGDLGMTETVEMELFLTVFLDKVSKGSNPKVH